MSEPSLSLSETLCLVGLFLAPALGFLLLGWRLGRENAGKPMFAFPPVPGAEPEDSGAEPDPWTEAMRGPGTVFPESADDRGPGQGRFAH
jgi:hypothetical protein